MRGLLMRALLGALLVLCPGRAWSYSLASGFTDSCHERLTLAAMGLLIDQLGQGVALPDNDLWKKVASVLAPQVLEAAGREKTATLTPEQQFLLFSAVVGVRSPDTGGHSVSNIGALRREQVDPDASAQHVHCLRGPHEDGVAGDLSVLEGAEQLVRQEVAGAAAAARRTGQARNISARFALDFYGEIQVEVDEAAYRAARAMHTLQDAHSHTLRSPDGAIVFTVLNYIDAVAGTLDEPRDGMAHSDTMDDCYRADLRPLVARATAVSNALARAVVAMATTSDDTLLEAGFAPCSGEESDTTTCGWLAYQPACAAGLPRGDQSGCCTQANGYCGSPYRPIAREKLTQPYLKTIFGCQAARGRPGWLGVAVVLLLWRRRRLLRLAFAGALCLVAAPAQATVVAGVEGHLSLFSDVPERSLINATMGYAVRGGYRRGNWGLLAEIERNYWLPTELSREIQAGALNIGVGGELLSAGGLIRSSAVVGPSILLFHTGLDDKGTVGLFLDLRPAGLHWTIGRGVAVVLDPLTVALVAPVLHSPSIHQLEYRTLLGVEIAL
jgi:hypothetical protein